MTLLCLSNQCLHTISHWWHVQHLPPTFVSRYLLCPNNHASQNTKVSESFTIIYWNLNLLFAWQSWESTPPVSQRISFFFLYVQENAEMEWKHCRTKMMTEYILDGAVLPPPFNLVPDVWSLLRCLRPKKMVGYSFNFIITKINLVVFFFVEKYHFKKKKINKPWF